MTSETVANSFQSSHRRKDSTHSTLKPGTPPASRRWYPKRYLPVVDIKKIVTLFRLSHLNREDIAYKSCIKDSERHCRQLFLKWAFASGKQTGLRSCERKALIIISRKPVIFHLSSWCCCLWLRYVGVCYNGELFNPQNDETDHPIRAIEILHRGISVNVESVPHAINWMDPENWAYSQRFLLAHVGQDWSILRWHGLGNSRHHFCTIEAKEFFLF